MGRPLRHGESINGVKSPEYRAWSAMKARCSNPNDREFKNYGARGIAVCEQWRTSFETFLADMGRRPGPGFSIDRIDNNHGYEPGNCWWATTKQQARNYRRNHLLTWRSRTMTMVEWAEETGIPYSSLEGRLRLGWTIHRALSTPQQCGWEGAATNGKDRKTHCANGHEYTPETSGRDSKGWRFCRICNRERSKNYMRAKRAENNT